jgi:hypothetical protein
MALSAVFAAWSLVSLAAVDVVVAAAGVAAPDAPAG